MRSPRFQLRPWCESEMISLRKIRSDGLVVRVAPAVWGVATVVAGAIAAFVVLAFTLG
jgi:hypothetical protein